MSLWHERLVPERFRGTRWDPGPRGTVILAGIGVVAILLALLVSFRERPVVQPVPPIATLSDSSVTDPEAAGEGTSGGTRTSAPKPSGSPRSSNAQASQPAKDAPPVGKGLPSASVGSADTSNAPDANASGELVISVVGLVEHGGLRRFPSGARIADALRAATPRPEADLSGLNLAQPLCDGDQLVIGRTTSTPRSTTQQTGSTLTNGTKPPTSATAGDPTRSAGPPTKVNLNTATEADLDTIPGVGPITARAILGWRTRHGRFTSIDQLTEIDGIGPSRLAKLRAVVTI